MASNLPVVHHSLDQYMLEVGRVPLLTRDEERVLAERLRDDTDIDAAKKLVASNLRFVVKIAFEYKNYNIRITDLIQEGNIGLMHAVSKFDPDRGYRLISYAVWWIKAYIQNYIIKNWSMVPVSARRKALFGKRRALPNGDEPTTPDLGEGAGDVVDNGVETDETHYLIAAEPTERPTIDSAREELQLARRDFSLDSAVGDDSAVTHVMRLPSHSPSAEDQLATEDVRMQVQDAITRTLTELDDRGRYILEHRLLADEPESLSDIGEKFGISRERARQLEVRIKDKLKKALAHFGETQIEG
jgi:RNA polymerase sigma-32 factor